MRKLRTARYAPMHDATGRTGELKNGRKTPPKKYTAQNEKTITKKKT